MSERKLKQTIDGLRKENDRLSRAAGADTPAARGRFRCLLAGLLVSLSFIAGGVLGDLHPSLLEQVQAWITSMPTETLAWLASPPGMAASTSVLAILIVATLLLSGLRSRLAYIPPMFALMAVAALFGMIPMGNTPALEGRIVILKESLSEEQARAEFAVLEAMTARENAERRIRGKNLEISRLEARIARKDQELDDAGRLAAFKDDLIRKRDGEIHRYIARLSSLTGRLAVLNADNSALRDVLGEKESLISRLRRERDDTERELRNLQSGIGTSGR